jgi:hypothetical protein
MTVKTLSIDLVQPAAESKPSAWTGIYRAGAIAALLVVLAGLLDISIMFLPATGFIPGERTVLDWFNLYQAHGFLALRDMGILNVLTTSGTVLVFFALFGAHRRANAAPAALALMVMGMGAAIYIANNMALPMLSLSRQYAAATSEGQKALLVSAGQVLLAQEDVGAGSFISFFIPEIGGVLMALVMLRGRVFSRWAGGAGLLGEACLMVFNILAAFVPGAYPAAMVFAMIGGPLSMAWFALTAAQLLQADRLEARTLPLSSTPIGA